MTDTLAYRVAAELERRAKLAGRDALVLTVELLLLDRRADFQAWADEGFPDAPELLCG